MCKLQCTRAPCFKYQIRLSESVISEGKKENVNIFPPSLLTPPFEVSSSLWKLSSCFWPWKGQNEVVRWMACHGCSGLGHCRHLDTRYIVVRLRMYQVQWSAVIRVDSMCWLCSLPWNHRGIFPWHSLLIGVHFSFHSSAPFSFYVTLAPVSGSFVGTWEGDQHTFPPKKHRCFQS